MQRTLLLYVTLFSMVDKHQHSRGTCWLIILDPESGASMFFLNIGAYIVRGLSGKYRAIFNISRTGSVTLM